jgi:hypothetical protein
LHTPTAAAYLSLQSVSSAGAVSRRVQQRTWSNDTALFFDFGRKLGRRSGGKVLRLLFIRERSRTSQACIRVEEENAAGKDGHGDGFWLRAGAQVQGVCAGKAAVAEAAVSTRLFLGEQIPRDEWPQCSSSAR